MSDDVERSVEATANKLFVRVLTGLAVLVGAGVLSFQSWIAVEAMENREFRFSTSLKIATIENRLKQLEDGITTPMAATTKTEFLSVWRAIDALKTGTK